MRPTSAASFRYLIPLLTQREVDYRLDSQVWFPVKLVRSLAVWWPPFFFFTSPLWLVGDEEIGISSSVPLSHSIPEPS
ncbi:hypothetical protein MRX96_052194 [Rhipicephalus microplus]